MTISSLSYSNQGIFTDLQFPMAPLELVEDIDPSFS